MVAPSLMTTSPNLATALALAGAGLYLLVIAAAAYYVRFFGGDWGRALQMALLFAGLVVLGALLFSGAVRARLRHQRDVALVQVAHGRHQRDRRRAATADFQRGAQTGDGVVDQHQ